MSVNLEQAFGRFERRLTIRLFWMMLGVMGLMHGTFSSPSCGL